MARKLSRTAYQWLVVLAAILIVQLVGSQAAFAAACASPSKCGLPLVSLQAASTDLFRDAASANPSLYPNEAIYHVFYDSRSRTVSFQDGDGRMTTPPANARNFVVVWHDGSSTDWRYIDKELAARVPATAKADELAHIVWAIKAATLAPQVILTGSAQDLAFAHYYVGGKAADQFSGAADVYNNDFHGMLATDATVSKQDEAQLNALGIATLLKNGAVDSYSNKATALMASGVTVVNGIEGAPERMAAGQAVQLTSKIGPVVWSVVEGPSVATISRSGVLILKASRGTVHVAAVSRTQHDIVALTSATVVPVGPMVTTSAVTGLTASGATFHGSVNPNGASGSAGFQYSTSATFAPAYGTTTVAVSGSSATAITVVQTRLHVGTQYYVRAFFSNASTHVTTFGNVVSFKTWGSFITTTNASAGTSSGATLNAIVNAGGVAGFVYFKYSPDNFVHTYYTTHIAVPGDFTTHTISATVSKLSTSTAYQYEPVFDQSANGGPVRAGVAKAFSTFGIFAENSKPNWAVSITQHGATFPGLYGTGGAACRVWLEISTSPTFAGGASVIGAFNVAAGTYAYQPVALKATTLSRNTTYYIRYAIRNSDNGFTYRYPYTRSFKTLP